MGAFDDAAHIEPASRDEWRTWLEAHHATATGVWLVLSRATSRPEALGYEAAVEEALCFGWIDSRAGRVDDRRTRLYFAPRRSRSGWAAPNKARVERLLAEGRMAPAGLAAVAAAKANGAWTLLDGVEQGELPDDLAAALDARPPGRANWDGFPRSVRRAALERIALARRPETRARRIAEIATDAQRGVRPGS